MRFLLLALAFFFFIVWIMAFIVYHAAGFFIHILLILALVFIMVHLFRQRPAP